MDLIVTSGGLGPTADDLTAEVVAALRRPRAGPRRGGRGEDRRDPARLRQTLQLRRGRGDGGEPQAGDGARGSDGARPGGDRAGAGRARRRADDRRPAGAAARAAADVAGGAGERAACASCSGGRRRCTATRCGCSASPSPKSPRACARSRRRGWRCPRSRSPPACGAARSRSTSAIATRRRRPPRRCGRDLPSATAPTSSARTGRRSTRRSRGCWPGTASASPSPAAAGCWRRGSPTPPGASAYMAGSVVAYSNEAKVELLGVDPELIERHGAVSPEVAEAMAKGALERFDGRRRGLDHRDRRARRRQRGEAGRLRLLQRAPRRRDLDRPRSGDPGRPRGHPRTLGAGRDAPAAHSAGRRESLLCSGISGTDSLQSRVVPRARPP